LVKTPVGILPLLRQWPRARPVVLKVVDIDPQGSIRQSKGSINSHGVEWGSLNG